MTKYCETLDGKNVVWNPNLQRKKDSEHKSAFHLICRNLLKEIYSTFCFLEEVTIPIKDKKIAYLDFYIPIIHTAIEVHGQQHYKFNPHFHTNSIDFMNQKNRDRDKRLWCELNKIKLIELSYKDGKDQWKKQILQ